MLVKPRQKEDLFQWSYPMITDRDGSRPLYYLYQNGKLSEAHDIDTESYKFWYQGTGIQVVVPNEMC